MASFGSMQLAWANGYRGSRTEFISENVICFKCGDCIKFVDTDDQQLLYSTAEDSIGPLAVHSINKVFAYSVNAVMPNIYVLQYPSFQEISTLSDGAKLEYLALSFSSSEYLASITGVPDYQLIIWKYTNQTKLYAQDLPQVNPTWVCFNPVNWHQLAICSAKEVTVWNLEQSNTTFLMKKQCYFHRLPERNFLGKYKQPVQSKTNVEETPQAHRRARLAIEVPRTAIAGLLGEEDFTKFEDYQDEQERVIPVNMCWLTSGDLLVSCSGGQLIKVDVEYSSLTVLSYLTEKPDSELSKGQNEDKKGHLSPKKGNNLEDKKSREETNAVTEKEENDTNTDEKEESKGTSDVISSGSLNCLALHQRGIFAAGNDGVIRILKILENEYYALERHNIGVPVTSLFFDPSYHMLVLGSIWGSVYLCNPESISETRLLFAIHYGNFVAACGIASTSTHCVTVRESGEVQIWETVTGHLISSLSIGAKVSSLAASPLVHMAIAGSETGYAYILDLNNLQRPRIVHSIHLHHSPIRFIVFNDNGLFFMTGSNDGIVIVVDGRPSRNFEPLGYVTCPGDVKGIATFMQDGTSKVAVVCDTSDTPTSKSPANKLLCFTLPDDLADNVQSKLASLKCDFKDEAINRITYNFPEPVIAVTLTENNCIYVICYSTKEIQKIIIPQEVEKPKSMHEEVPESMAKSVIASRLEYRRRRQFVVSPQISSDKRRRMSVMGPGMTDQSLAPASPATRTSASPDVRTASSPASSEGGIRRQSIFGSMDQVPSPEPVFVAPEHKEVSSLDLLKIRRASVAEGQMSGIMKLVNIMKTSESLIDKDTSDILAAQEAEKSKDTTLTVSEKVRGHQLPGGCISMSPHHKWLASGGGDGKIAIREIATLNKPLIMKAHNFWRDGILMFSFMPDGQSILTSGYDGTLLCFRWNFSVTGKQKGREASEAATSLLARLRDGQVKEDGILRTMEEWTGKEVEPSGDKEQKLDEEEKEIEKAVDSNEIYTPPSPEPPADATWQDIKRIEAQKELEKKHAEEKKNLRMEIQELRRKLREMMSENEIVPQIEKLPHPEFDLDVDEQKRLQEDADNEVQKLREEKEYQNMAKLYLAEVIKKECWDDMSVKGRGIVAFNTGLEVNNYPMKERTRQELRELETVQSQRRIEMAELEARKEIADALTTATKDSTGPEDEPTESDELEQQVNRERSAITGSLGYEVGGDSELFYNQFDLVTREQKQNQVVLLQDAIYRIRTKFNKDFDEVCLRKEQEIVKIKEKNKRIRKIMEDLGLPDEPFEPELGPVEKPEMLFTTDDSEVKVEKYLTPEQWKKLEEERKIEEERRLKERADNWRERGLDQMMGGVLEIKKEDALKQDIPVPLFMQEKKEEEWNEDEKKAADEYKQKVKDLEEERDKFRKQLEQELKKMQGLVQEGTQAFDELLNQLFVKKVKTESVIYQEELKILRLRFSLLTDEEFTNYEKDLHYRLDKARHSVQLATNAVTQAKQQLDDFRNEYDIHIADDRVHERMFRREFQLLPPLVIDQLFKQYKKRPRGQKAKTIDLPDKDSSSNPFADRPSTAQRNEEARQALNLAMVELNSEKNIPVGVDNLTWDHFCNYRMEKIEKEIQIKQEALILAEMQAFLQKRHEEEEKLKMEIEEYIEAINKLHETRHIFNTNLEVQLLLKQGQVEVDPGSFIPNYRTTLLIHRDVVEELNKKIRHLGAGKIASMVESKDFRKGIVVLEWEHKKMMMEMEDLRNRMKDIMNLRVTREIQMYLTSSDYDALKNQEIAALEQMIVLQKQYHEQHVKEKKKSMKMVKKSMFQLVEKNKALGSELEGLNVLVNEKRHILEVNPDKLNALDQQGRYKDIMERRRLIDLAKAQAQEIAMLRTELERLRMRTFPALVQRDK